MHPFSRWHLAYSGLHLTSLTLSLVLACAVSLDVIDSACGFKSIRIEGAGLDCCVRLSTSLFPIPTFLGIRPLILTLVRHPPSFVLRMSAMLDDSISKCRSTAEYIPHKFEGYGLEKKTFVVI